MVRAVSHPDRDPAGLPGLGNHRVEFRGVCTTTRYSASVTDLALERIRIEGQRGVLLHQAAELKADEEVTQACVVRFLNPKVLKIHIDFEVAHDREQKIMHLWVSANRDEREFDEPDRFDIHRRAPRVLTFNHARHRCLGAHVAQMEGRVLLEELLTRQPDFDVDEDQVVRIRSEFFRGYDRMPLVFG